MTLTTMSLTLMTIVDDVDDDVGNVDEIVDDVDDVVVDVDKVVDNVDDNVDDVGVVRR